MLPVVNAARRCSQWERVQRPGRNGYAVCESVPLESDSPMDDHTTLIGIVDLRFLVTFADLNATLLWTHFLQPVLTHLTRFLPGPVGVKCVTHASSVYATASACRHR